MLPATLDRVLPVPLCPAGRSDGNLLSVAICHAWVRKVRVVSLAVAPALLISFAGCAAEPSEDQSPATDRLILAGYSVAAPVYQSEIIPLFQSFWRERSGREVVVDSTFGSSGAQVQAVIGGFAARLVKMTAMPPEPTMPMPRMPGGHQPAPMVGSCCRTHSTMSSLGLRTAKRDLFSEPPPFAATMTSTLSPGTMSL